jgi:hypothetical protein
MMKRLAVWLALPLFLISCPVALAQAGGSPPKAPGTKAPAAQSPGSEAQKKNMEEYIALMRTNVRQQKSEIMGAIMQLDVDDAAKFWPIYSEYNAELTKVNNMRIQNIQDYAQNYDQMTDQKADELIQTALSYQKQRGELLAKYYDRMKQALGATTAARFLQVENQLLLIIDLQINSSLPIVGQGS